MIYFSELQGQKVITEDGVSVGKLSDLIFQASEQPLITKIIVSGKDNHIFIIPIIFFKKIDVKEVIVSKGYEIAEISENELYVLKNLLDKQIIDISGNKIVRVNDVAFQDKPSLSVAGVDIGFLGVLRWMKLEDIVSNTLNNLFKIKISSRFLPWGDIQPLELARGKVVLNKDIEKLEKIAPEDLADHLEKTTILNVRKIIDLLDEEYAAEVVGNLNINFQTALFKQIDPQDAAEIIQLIDPDEAVDILLTLSEPRREHIMSYLKEDYQKELQYLFQLSQTPIGEMLTTEFADISPENTVSEVIDKVRKDTRDFSFMTYMYAVKNNQLVGVVSLHELLLQNANTNIYKFMTTNVVVVHLTTPLEIAIKKMLKYKLFALPVIDKDKKILGIITFDDITEEILKKI